jgi:hypothetical protein
LFDKQTKRLTGLAVWIDAQLGGTIASNIGSAMATPAPFKKLRRLSVGRM